MFAVVHAFAKPHCSKQRDIAWIMLIVRLQIK
jgi:hypothetical protein